MAGSARFEIVRGDAGHWVRFIAANSRTVFTSETYRRKSGAETAILSIAHALGMLHPSLVETDDKDWSLRSVLSTRPEHGVPVVFVDERTPKP